MMPTRGRGPFRRFLLGSITAKVLHHARWPVWTSSHAEHAAPASCGFDIVICAVDLSQNSAAILAWASRLTSLQNAKMRVVHAVNVEEESTNRGVVEVRRYLSDKAYEQWQFLQETMGIRAPLHIVYGNPGKAVRKAAHDLKANLVIIGRGRIQDPIGRLRAHSYAIIRESPCPVVSV
jgi:nucleotide-binding universal stress UspA family protein